LNIRRTRRFKEKMELHIIILRKRLEFKAFALTIIFALGKIKR